MMAMPAARPSRPSIRLNAFVTPTIQNHGHRDAQPAQLVGHAEERHALDGDARRDHHERARRLGGQFRERRRAAPVVHDANPEREGAAGDDGDGEPDVHAGLRREARDDGQEREGEAPGERDAHPAEPRRRHLMHLPPAGRVHHAQPAGEPRERRRQQPREERGDNRDEGVGHGGSAV